MKGKFGVEAELDKPRVAYRETIRKTVKAEGKHKKQSGGHGQYGHVWIEFSPTEGDELVFEEKVFGGAVPKNYFPAVEKGLQDAKKYGVLAGYPVVVLKATLLDGIYPCSFRSSMKLLRISSEAQLDSSIQNTSMPLQALQSSTIPVPQNRAKILSPSTLGSAMVTVPSILMQ